MGPEEFHLTTEGPVVLSSLSSYSDARNDSLSIGESEELDAASVPVDVDQYQTALLDDEGNHAPRDLGVCATAGISRLMHESVAEEGTQAEPNAPTDRVTDMVAACNKDGVAHEIATTKHRSFGRLLVATARRVISRAVVATAIRTQDLPFADNNSTGPGAEKSQPRTPIRQYLTRRVHMLLIPATKCTKRFFG